MVETTIDPRVRLGVLCEVVVRHWQALDLLREQLDSVATELGAPDSQDPRVKELLREGRSSLMTTTTTPKTDEQQLRELEERDEQQRDQLKERLSSVAERGGLPGYQDLEEVRGYLEELAKILEEHAMDVSIVARAEAYDVPLPFAVETEQVAVLGLLPQLVRESLGDYREYVNGIERDLQMIEDARRHESWVDNPNA